MNLAADWRLAVVIGGAAGLALAPFWMLGEQWLKALLVLVLTALALVERGRVRGMPLVLIGVAAAMVGLLAGGARVAAIDGGALEGKSGPVNLSGFVLEPPSVSRGTARFGLATGQGRVLVEADSAQAENLPPGTGVELEGELLRAPDWMRADLERRGIAMVLNVERLRRDGTKRGGLAGLVDQLRDRALAALELAVPDREAALSRGFVLGDDSRIDRRTTEDFRDSGLSHLLAVSGQNIVLLALLAIPVLSLLGFGPRARLLSIALLILVYVPLAGGGPSIQRAGVMGLAGLAAVAATRAPSRAYALAAAAMVTLALNPRATGDIGWQLSFAAVIGIMLLAGPLQQRLEPLIGNGGWRRLISEGIAVTVSATIATAPLLAFHFERLPVATLLANLLAMPAVAPAMWAGMISVAAGQVSPMLAVPSNLAGSVFLAWIAQVAEWFGRPSWATIEISLGGPVALVAALLVTVLSSLTVMRHWRISPTPIRPVRWLPIAATLLLLLLVALPGLLGSERRKLDAPPAGGARVEVLDVGQGDAILIRPAGEEPMLIDGGPPGGDLAGALDSAGVDHLKAVLLTHPDLDHFGGLEEIFGLIPIDRFLFDRAPAALISLASDSGAEPGRVSAGESVTWGGLSLELIWPPDDSAGANSSGEAGETNLRSIAALLKWGRFRMLLTGDAEAESVPLHPGPIDVLKVSHHGSRDSALPTLLDESSPRLAVISVGEQNSYGHPAPEVLNELRSSRVPTARTDLDGTVSIVLTPGERFAVETGN